MARTGVADRCQRAATGILDSTDRHGGGGRTVEMWQRFLERFVPLMDGEPSRLDLLDGVTSATDLATTDQGASLVSVTAVPSA
jgi:hypothetical protein